jgi:hypothetical protein
MRWVNEHTHLMLWHSPNFVDSCLWLSMYCATSKKALLKSVHILINLVELLMFGTPVEKL